MNGYCVTPVLRKHPYLVSPSTKDPNTGAPGTDTAGALATFDVPQFKDPMTGLRSSRDFGGVAVPHHSADRWIGSFIYRNLISASKNPLVSPVFIFQFRSTFPGPAPPPSLISSGQIKVVEDTVIDVCKVNLSDGLKLSIRPSEDDKTVIGHNKSSCEAEFEDLDAKSLNKLLADQQTLATTPDI
ncbi:hypothetical protein IW261DRAFT_1418647 [Armillaria novae-zelandiae]|uniref:Uncharacterized protein n=1 Tax=Armillaria novae-zelandiae TaxID=153914 RepID=A0AA39PD35_9AGAR|nr:hypothetical protein IW261DRAFT_1418647 [Armillaria novae-zelandiae]